MELTGFVCGIAPRLHLAFSRRNYLMAPNIIGKKGEKSSNVLVSIVPLSQCLHWVGRKVLLLRYYSMAYLHSIKAEGICISISTIFI